MLFRSSGAVWAGGRLLAFGRLLGPPADPDADEPTQRTYGLTEGYANPDLTVEDVRGHFAEIRDETGYTVPAGVADEIASLVRRLG